MNPGRAGFPSLLREGAAMVMSNAVSSILIATIVGAICAGVLATTGQTAAQESAVLSAIDEAGTRTIVVTDGSQGSGFDPGAVERISGLSEVESAIGLGPAFDVRNWSLAGGGEPAPARVVHGLPKTGIIVSQGRWPAGGEAVVGISAIPRLGMETPSGAILVPDGSSVPLVGGFAASGPFAHLEEGVLVAATEDDTNLRSVLVVARRPEVVEPLTGAIIGLLSPPDLSTLSIETSARLAEVRQAVEGELGRFSRRLIVWALTGGLALTMATVMGEVTMRRRDFGRRRVLGASRSAIVVLVLAQTGFAALVGSAIGSSVGLVVAKNQSGAAPPSAFVIGVDVLAVLTAVTAAALPAVLAALRDPVRVLRLP